MDSAKCIYILKVLLTKWTQFYLTSGFYNQIIIQSTNQKTLFAYIIDEMAAYSQI